MLREVHFRENVCSVNARRDSRRARKFGSVYDYASSSNANAFLSFLLNLTCPPVRSNSSFSKRANRLASLAALRSSFFACFSRSASAINSMALFARAALFFFLASASSRMPRPNSASVPFYAQRRTQHHTIHVSQTHSTRTTRRGRRAPETDATIARARTRVLTRTAASAIAPIAIARLPRTRDAHTRRARAQNESTHNQPLTFKCCCTSYARTACPRFKNSNTAIFSSGVKSLARMDACKDESVAVLI